MIPDDNEIFEALEQYAKTTEVSRATRFVGIRERPDGRSITVNIEIFDRGPSAGRLRWRVEATDDDIRFATGNPASTLMEALRDVHWAQLDRVTEEELSRGQQYRVVNVAH